MIEEKSEPIYDLFFSNGYDPGKLPESNWILIVPTKSSWNDFGHRCRCHLYIQFDHVISTFSDSLLVGFLPVREKQANPYDEKSISSLNFPQITGKDQFPQFFSLFTSMESYRKLVHTYGVENAKYILNALNDLVFLRKYSLKSELVKTALQTEVFTLAFMRDNETFFSYHNAEGILDGLSEEQVSVATEHYNLRLALLGSENEHVLKMDFDLQSYLPKRINVLIGRNGLGKSRTLNAIADSLMKADGMFSARDNSRVMVSRLLALATPGETQNTFPPESDKSRIPYRRLALNRAGQTSSSRGFGELCVQLARSKEWVAGKNRWRLFKDCLRLIEGPGDIVLELDRPVTAQATGAFNLKSKKYIPLVNLNNGGEQTTLETWASVKDNTSALRYINGKVVPLSSGELAFLKFAVQACLFIENGTMVLLDEPETHLHPNLISDFIDLLDKLLESTGSIAIIATHSAYFVREVPKSQVHVFKTLERDQVEIVNPRLNTFGADIGAISYFVFDDDITSVLIRKLEKRFKTIHDLDTYLSSEDAKELSSDIIMRLKKTLGDDLEAN